MAFLSFTKVIAVAPVALAFMWSSKLQLKGTRGERWVRFTQIHTTWIYAAEGSLGHRMPSKKTPVQEAWNLLLFLLTAVTRQRHHPFPLGPLTFSDRVSCLPRKETDWRAGTGGRAGPHSRPVTGQYQEIQVGNLIVVSFTLGLYHVIHSKGSSRWIADKQPKNTWAHLAMGLFTEFLKPPLEL